ncbi:hypothetical protein [Exiguobacterium sp. s91]|uniref:hypothetical protein n=1 Tax=Exiguobacterium sp. s91 TaxID=2751199 RepID=UPI001BE80A41|nr:hypothetical protein [Exiguobacterium sp. s91]
MKQYIQLTNEEIKRSFKLYVIVVLVMAAIELVSVVAQVMYHERKVENFMELNRVSVAEALKQIDTLGYSEASSFFSYMTLIGMAIVVIYAIQIWYRDWLGETKYIYRLLMLPGSRASIFFSKLTTVFLIIVSFIGIQWCVMQLGFYLFDWLIQPEYQNQIDLSPVQNVMSEFYTTNLIDMGIILAISLFIVSFIFLLILIERSFRKGKAVVKIGLEIFIAILIAYITVLFLDETRILLETEELILTIGINLLYFMYIIWKSLRLLQQKVTV